MNRLVGIVREQSEMEAAVPLIASLRQRLSAVGVIGNREFNPGWHTAMDLNSQLTVSEAIARSALMRKESRGAHFRVDYPEKDSEQGKVNTVVRRGDSGEMLVEQRPLPPMPPELQAIIEEMG